MNRTHFYGLVAVILSTLGYGLMPLFSSLAYAAGTAVESLLFTRFLVAAVLIWLLVVRLRIPFRTSRSHLLYLLAFSFVGYTLCAHFIFTAYTVLSGSLVTMIVFLHPAMIVAYELVSGKARPSRFKTAALFLTLAGLGVILWDPGARLNWPGVLMSLGGAVTYAWFCIALTEPRTRAMSSLAVTAYVISVSLAGYLALALAKGVPLIPAEPMGFWMSVVLGIVSTAFASLAFYWGIRRVGASTAALASTFEPVFVAAIGFAFLGDPLTGRFLVGSALILASLFLLQADSNLKPESAEPCQ